MLHKNDHYIQMTKLLAHSNAFFYIPFNNPDSFSLIWYDEFVNTQKPLTVSANINSSTNSEIRFIFPDFVSL